MEERIYRIKINLKSGEIEVEGDKEFVKGEMKNLINEIKNFLETEPSIQVLQKSERIQKTHAYKEPAHVAENLTYGSFAEFYKVLSPKKGQDKILVAAYWLDVKEGMKEIKPKDVENLLKNARITPPKSIGRDMSILASGKKAVLLKLKRGVYSVSDTGRKQIEDILKEKLENE
ncbi:MAG: hypothetical protein DRO88_12250 [Promethearchaeia archaeon]|uniref:Uncharacterized protein n=1 Tax=Desulfofervidus auxilii TaxID=1621989 RepID=A0A7C0U319_DESA2|nr:MAG: hypothetical protein DRO88_12250 [Candidatus Lokiarchaeia archaeon]HDD44125.1 hypothetical protein [Candidatus Desulfofervidus auxilii]